MKRLRSLAFCGLLFCAWGSVSAQTQNAYGLISGIVSDSAGIRQMGANVVMTTEQLGEQASTQRLTDRNGAFTLAAVRPGLYSLKVSLAGFMPAIQEHVLISPNLTTIVHIELGSVFASLDALRRTSSRPSEGDDWQWVLRTSPSTRTVLHVFDPAAGTATVSNSAEEPRTSRPRARIEMASGSLSPGSSSALTGPPATAASYDQSVGAAGRVMMAGRMSYAPELGSGTTTFAGVWLPDGEFDGGRQTVVVLQQASLDPVSGQSFHSLRAAHSEKLVVGRTEIDYGMAYLMAGTGHLAASVRPSLRIRRELSPVWTVAYSMQTEPDDHRFSDRGAALESALGALNTLPVIIWENGRSNIAGSWHSELALKRRMGERRSLEAATFRDSSPHTAVFGFDLDGANGQANTPTAAYAHDGGSTVFWGSRVVYREKLSSDWELSAIYAGASALALAPQEISTGNLLPDRLDTVLRHSLAARISGRVPGAHTRLEASYKWINRQVVSRQDLFGEAALGIDPYLSFSLKQPLPSFGKSGRWEALADFRNILAQGYVSVDDQADGHIVLTPVVRSFRGGLSFQF